MKEKIGLAYYNKQIKNKKMGKIKQLLKSMMTKLKWIVIIIILGLIIWGVSYLIRMIQSIMN